MDDIFDKNSPNYWLKKHEERGFKLNKHCEATEQCADDVYCNCWCRACATQPCHRPGCDCSKEHVR